jgi:lipopolysaccharide export system protein LptA
MICKTAGMVAFLVLSSMVTVGGANDKDLSHKKLVPPEIGFSTPLRASSDYFSLGQSCNQPIDITSKNVNTKNIPGGKEVAFEGNVNMKQGDVTLSCDRLVIVYDEKTVDKTGEGKVKKLSKGQENASQIKSITASGNVKIVQNERMAVADEALYDNVNRTIRLKGGRPKLGEGSDVLIGDPIFIYLE